MRPPKPIPSGTTDRLRALLRGAKTKAEFQTIQCVWLRARLNLPARDVAEAIGWHPSSVRRVQSLFLKEGEEALKRVGRGGGRRHENLTLEQETGLLAPFLEKMKSGEDFPVKEVKAIYEKTLGREVPKSTIYRMLSRHGWRSKTRRKRPGPER